MVVNNFGTVIKIVDYVKPLIDSYRKFQDEKEETIRALRIIFSTEADYVDIIVKDGKFVESFSKKMGKGRMKVLRNLLLNIDSKYYSTIDFRID